MPIFSGLRGWVSFYHDTGIVFLVVPISLGGIGIVGLVRKGLPNRPQITWGSLKNTARPGWVPSVIRQNNIATIAIVLSVINFGLLMWGVGT